MRYKVKVEERWVLSVSIGKHVVLVNDASEAGFLNSDEVEFAREVYPEASVQSAVKPPEDILWRLREANIERDKVWDPRGQINFSFRGNELAGEVGEACNVIKKLERERLGLKGSRTSVMELADELADVVICADLTAMDAGIDLRTAIIHKFNETSRKNGLEVWL